MHKHHDTFANGPKGKIRRDDRRARIAAERVWLEI